MPKEINVTCTLEAWAFEELPSADQALLREAHEAVERAYAPYTGFREGAAVLLENGEFVTGNNQENAAYPSGLCAERVALFAANANYPEAKVVAIATGNAWAIPLIDGASTAANGGDLGDVLKTVAVSYVSQAIGGEVAQHTAPFVDEFIGESLSAGVKELAGSAITQGTVGATQAI